MFLKFNGQLMLQNGGNTDFKVRKTLAFDELTESRPNWTWKVANESFIAILPAQLVSPCANKYLKSVPDPNMHECSTIFQKILAEILFVCSLFDIYLGMM